MRRTKITEFEEKTKSCQNHEGSCTSGYRFRKPKKLLPSIIAKKHANFGISGSDTGVVLGSKREKSFTQQFTQVLILTPFLCRVSLHNEAHTFRFGFFIKLETFSKLVQHSGKSVKTQFPRVLLLWTHKSDVSEIRNSEVSQQSFFCIDGQASRCFRTMGNDI